MNEVLLFLENNWQWCVTVVFAFASFLLLLFKKRPLASNFKDILNYIVTKIPGFINEAEKKCESGILKKEFVMNWCLRVLNIFCKCSSDDIDVARQFFDEKIEEILSTPQKK